MIKKVIILVIVFAFFEACICPKKRTESRINNSVDKIETLACSKFNSDFEIRYNKKASFALVSTSKTLYLAENEKNLNYFVYSIKKEKVIIEDSLKNGEIQLSKKNTICVSENNSDNNNNSNRIYFFDLKYKKYRFL
jgi:hypothetical protein